jgi:hypothetical protein
MDLTYNVSDDAYSNATYLVEDLPLFDNGGLYYTQDSDQLTHTHPKIERFGEIDMKAKNGEDWPKSELYGSMNS